MDESNQGGMSPQVCRLLAGLEAGVWAGLAMLAWIMFGSALSNQPVWSVPNLLATLISGRSWRPGFSVATLPGLALLLFTSGLVGMLFGALVREPRSRLRVRLLGLVAGLVWYYVSSALFWQKVGPLLSLYSSSQSLLVAYLIFGASLGWYPRRWRSLQCHPQTEPPTVAPAPDPGPGSPDG
jgi:hypothetical protein